MHLSADLKPVDYSGVLPKRGITPDDLLVIFVCISQMAQGLDPYLPALRYIQYAVGPMALTVWLTVGGRKWSPHSNRFFLATCLLLGAISFSTLFTDSHDFRIVNFLVLPLSIGMFITSVTEKHINWLWHSVITSGILFGIPNFMNPQVTLNLVYSGSIAESQMSFPLSIMILTLFATKQWNKLVFGAVLFTLMLKRIALGGMLLSVAIWALTNPISIRRMIDRNWRRSAGMSMTLFLILGTVAFNFNQIAYAIFLAFRDLFDTVERITLGRYAFAEALTTYMDGSGSFLSNLFGFGPGSARSIIGEPHFRTSDFNVLNDYLLVRFEYGTFGLVVFFAAYAIAIGQSRWGLILCAYQALVFMTDNTLIYAFHTQVLVVCSIYLMQSTKPLETITPISAEL